MRDREWKAWGYWSPMSPEFLPARICRNNPETGNQSPPPGLEPLNKIFQGWVSELRGTNAEVTLKGSSCQCSIGEGGVADEREREKGGRERGREREVKRGDCFYTLFNFTTTDSPPLPGQVKVYGLGRWPSWARACLESPSFLVLFLPTPGGPSMQVVRDQMRQMQHRLQQKRLRDARTVQGVPHRVFPLCCLQPTAHPGRRICAAGGWAFLPRGPRCGGEGQPGSWRPSQSLASSAAAANGRYFSKQREAGGKASGG